MTKTGLKRKVVNDRLALTRAKPSDLTVRITPLYGRRLYMTDYPYYERVSRGKEVIYLASPIYRHNMKTGFFSEDGTKMYLREYDSSGKPSADDVRSVRGRTIPRLFEELKMKERFQKPLVDALISKMKAFFKV